MSPAPRVSIVMPVFDDEATVASALESCLAQTLTEIEVICVDDASKDGTGAVVQRYAALDSRVRYIRLQTNSSAIQARRVGAHAAAGSYVLFVDGDDELVPQAAHRALSAAIKARADLVGFGVEVLGRDGEPMGGYQKRLDHRHRSLAGPKILDGLFPVDGPAQGQLWRFLMKTELVREAYAHLPSGLVLRRVNDLPLLYLVAALAVQFVSIEDRLYRYHYGRGASGNRVASMDDAAFHAAAIDSIHSIAPAVRSLARAAGDPGRLMVNYESVRLSIIGYVTWYVLKHSPADLVDQIVRHLGTRTTAVDIVVAAARFYPETLATLKEHNDALAPPRRSKRSILLTTRKMATGGVSAVLLSQAGALLRAGHRVTIVARRTGGEKFAVPEGATYLEMTGTGLPARLAEWAEICRAHDVGLIIDHQVLYSKDWPEYALAAQATGAATVGWAHSFVGRPIYDGNGVLALIRKDSHLLETLISLSPLDAAFWKLRGVENSAFLPNPPSALAADMPRRTIPRVPHDQTKRLIWWGRLDEHTKRMSQLLDVAAHLRDRAVNFHLTIVGPDWKDWTAKRFNELAAKRNLSDHVRAIGERRGEELLAAIDRADAAIMTSVIEGYPLTITEAQAHGLPVFMYELPWLMQVQDNAGIVSVPQGDSRALAHAIDEALSDPQRYEALSKASLQAADRARSFDFDALYEQVVAGTLPPSQSPDPSLDDARQLIDLTIFYAEQAAANKTAAPQARAHSERRPTSSSLRGQPSGTSLAHRVWRGATPMGRIALQLFPRLRPLAHRAKRALVRGRR